MGEVRGKVGRVVRVEDDDDLQESVTPRVRGGTAGTTSEVRFEFNDGTVYRVDRRDPRSPAWLMFLRSKRESNDPVYVQADDDAVREVFAPSLRRVHLLKEERVDDRDVVVVFLLPTPSRRFLNPARPGFAEMLRTLEAARQSGGWVLVTVNPYDKEIIDVREAEVRPDEGVSNGPVAELDAPVRETFRRESVRLELTPISLRDAFREFDFLASRPFIPFGHIDDCCASRAHKMCDLLTRRGVESGKLFLYGSGFESGDGTLTGFHEDNPGVVARWIYHVAPVVSVEQEEGGARLMILDPSEFNTPRFEQTWIRHHRDGDATHEHAPARAWFRFPDGFTIPDDGLISTDRELEDHVLNRNIVRVRRPSR